MAKPDVRRVRAAKRHAMLQAIYDELAAHVDDDGRLHRNCHELVSEGVRYAAESLDWFLEGYEGKRHQLTRAIVVAATQAAFAARLCGRRAQQARREAFERGLAAVMADLRAAWSRIDSAPWSAEDDLSEAVMLLNQLLVDTGPFSHHPVAMRAYRWIAGDSQYAMRGDSNGQRKTGPVAKLLLLAAGETIDMRIAAANANAVQTRRARRSRR